MLPPDIVCARLNELLLAEIDTDRYLTMILADVDLATGQTTLSQAGHPSPAVQKADGTVQYCSSFGMPIGLIQGAEYTSFQIKLAAGDRLLLYSDGITECPIDQKGALLDETGLEKILNQLRRSKGTDFIDELLLSLTGVSGLDEFPDDLSAILLEYYGPPLSKER